MRHVQALVMQVAMAQEGVRPQLVQGHVPPEDGAPVPMQQRPVLVHVQ